MKSTTVITNSGNVLTAYVVAQDNFTAMLYVPSDECLVQSTHRVKGGWLIGNLTLESIVLNKKSRANRDLLEFLKRKMDK